MKSINQKLIFFYPIIAVILFLIVALITKIEDIVCLLIIGLPFLIAAGIIGILLGALVKDKVQNKKLYSIVLIPLLLNPIENLIPNKIENFKVRSEIIINKNSAEIFPNL